MIFLQRFLYKKSSKKSDRRRKTRIGNGAVNYSKNQRSMDSKAGQISIPKGPENRVKRENPGFVKHGSHLFSGLIKNEIKEQNHHAQTNEPSRFSNPFDDNKPEFSSNQINKNHDQKEPILLPLIEDIAQDDETDFDYLNVNNLPVSKYGLFVF